jgi:hypothetical protein
MYLSWIYIEAGLRMNISNLRHITLADIITSVWLVGNENQKPSVERLYILLYKRSIYIGVYYTMPLPSNRYRKKTKLSQRSHIQGLRGSTGTTAWSTIEIQLEWYQSFF